MHAQNAPLSCMLGEILPDRFLLMVSGERAMVPFTDKHYEAKVVKAQFREDGMWWYYVHYNGWNKKYDTWVRPTLELLALMGLAALS